MTLVRRRTLAFVGLGLAVVFAALALHVLDLKLPRVGEAPLVVAALVLVAWAYQSGRTRALEKAKLEADCGRLADAVQRFGARIEAWVVAGPADELEAEALRRSLIDRHTAMVASARAQLGGLDPSEDAVVQAMTRDKERKGRHGAALLQHLAALQREALAEAYRRGFLGEARLLALDEALFTLSAVAPLPRPTATPAARVLAGAVALYAPLIVLTTSSRLTQVFAAALAGALLITFEALANAPLGPDDDPRPRMLAAW